MPLQLRNIRGEVQPLDKTHVIEILDMSGNLAVVVTQSPTGSISILTPGDPQFSAHANVTRQRISKVRVHAPSPDKNQPDGLTLFERKF